jgi:hypothetical protein
MEGSGVGVRALDFNGKFDGEAVLAATVHKFWFAFKMVAIEGGETQVTWVTRLGLHSPT